MTANALHPGVVRTDFGAEDPAGSGADGQCPCCAFMKTPAAGRGHLDLPRLVTGCRRRHRPVLRQPQTQDLEQGRSYDTDAADRLWQVSADLVGLTSARPS